MAKLHIGTKSPVFVTHVEFLDGKCQIYCQVGDVGGQADTIAERVAESVENGIAGHMSNCAVGNLCLALFHEDNSWYRARILETSAQSVKVFFMDYGNTETVRYDNVREASDYVLSIPALSTRCIVHDCAPLSDPVWREEEKKKIETMLHSGEFTSEIVAIDTTDVNNPCYTVKLYTLDAPNTPIFVRPASKSSASQSLPVQNLQIGQQYEIFVAYVDSASKFWVQLKSQENELNSLTSDIGACFAEDLPSTGDLVNPVKGQICASCFTEDSAFYRAIVQNIEGDKCHVFYVDYGNGEKKCMTELFTLPQALCKLPMQAIMCLYMVREASPSVVEDQLHELSAAGDVCKMTVLSGSAISGYVVHIDAVENKLNRKKQQPAAVSQTSASSKAFHSYSPVIMQTNGVYDVCISHVETPGKFSVQLLGNAPNLDKVMQDLEQVAHNCDKVVSLQPGAPCLAKLSDDAWYRCEVVSVVGQNVTVVAVDFGFVETVLAGQIRSMDPRFTSLPSQSVPCSIEAGSKAWSEDDIERFKTLTEKSALIAKVVSKQNSMYQLDLFETGGQSDRHINKEFSKVSGGKPTPLPGQIPMRTPQALSQPQIQRSPAVSKALIPAPEISLGSKHVLCFTAVKLPYLYGQVTHTPVEKVAKLQTELNKYFDSNPGETLQMTKAGNFCCTQYVDGGWYRGMIASIQGGKAVVEFVDFGDSVMTLTKDLKVLPADLCSLPQQCILCRIENLPLSVQQVKLEKALVNNRVEVLLTRKEDGNFPTFSGEITNSQILSKLEDRPTPVQGGFKGASSRSLGSRPQQREEQSSATRPIRKPLGSEGGFTQQTVAVGSTQGVMVTYVEDPSNFRIVLDKMSPTLDVVMDQLHEHYDKLPAGAEQLINPRLGQPCVAQYTEDMGWYRAVVTGLKTSGAAEVMYVDYGNTDSTMKEALKVIKPELMALPAQAVRCTLSGVAPQQGFWPPEHAVNFKDLVEEQSFTGTFTMEVQEQGQVVYKVELVDKKGENINQKFGTKTNTLCAETQQGPTSRAVTFKSTGGSGWDENDSSSSFSSQRPIGHNAGSGFGSQGFGSRSGGDGRGSFGGRSNTDSEGFGSRGSSDNRGFGSRPAGGGGGFGSRQGGDSGGFSSRSGGDSGFGTSSGGFGSRSGGDSGFGSSSGGFGSDKGGGGGGSRDCYKCGESGHISRECPNAASKGGGGRECFKCGESGHMARDCPNQSTRGGGGGGRDCFKCGESGHMARDCPNPPKAGGGRDCYKCGEPGHLARDCPNPEKAGGGRGGSRDCFKCGETGHMARDCPNPDAGGQRRQVGFGGDRSGGFGGGGERSGGFGRNSGFGSRGSENNSSEDWGSGRGSAARPRGGFGGSSDGGSRGGGFGTSGGGFGGVKKPESDWGETSGGKPGRGFGNRGNDEKSGGFGGSSGGGFGGATSPSGDDWDTEVKTVDVKTDTGAGDAGAATGHLNEIQLGLRESVDVYVVYTSSPELFWCQVIKSCGSLESLMTDMNSFYNSLPEGDMVVSSPKVDMPCAAKFSQDNMWYRAKIVSLEGSSLDVQFVDYGNSENITGSNVKVLKPEFMKLPAQGIRCGLEGVVAANKTWTDQAFEDFEDATNDKHLVAKVISKSPDSKYLMDLECVDEKINVAELMFEKGHCTFVSSKGSPKKEPVVNSPYQPLPVTIGQEMNAYLTWTETPERFWVQPTSQEDNLAELVEKIQELYTTGAGVNLKVASLTRGLAVVAPFSEDSAWYRGYIESIMGQKCKVRFIDYGNSDMAECESLRLPTEELLKEPAQAMMCKLAGVRPLQTGVWTADAKDIMESLVKEEAVEMKVLETSNGHCTVEVIAGGSSLGKELIKAAVVRPEKDSPQPGTVISAEHVEMLEYTMPPSLNVGSAEKVYVTHTDSVASFWCQPVSTGPQLDKVMHDLEQHCTTGTGLSNLPVNLACGAKYQADGLWYRAQVSATYPDSVEVLFVDYGNTEKVPYSDICLLTRELVELPPQAVQCELENASQASNQLTAKFIELLEDKEATAMVLEVQDGIPMVSLTLDNGMSVGQELGLPSSTLKAAVAVSKPSPVLMFKPAKVPSSANVFISYSNSPSDFYVQLTEQQDQLNALMEKLEAMFVDPQAVATISSVSQGQACCCWYTKDEAWYRAKVVKVMGQKAFVEFVDFGNSEEAELDSIKEISEELIKLAPFAIKCELSKVQSVQGKWSAEALTEFEDLTIDKELSCTFDTSCKVHLTVDGKDIADSLVQAGHAKRQEESAKCYPIQTLPVDSVSCYVCHVEDNGVVYLQLACEEEMLATMTDKVQKLESEPEVTLAEVIPKQAICAKFCDDEAWYRAEVTSTSKLEVGVRFVDFGNTSFIKESSDLRQLPDKCLDKPPFAYPCKLEGVGDLTAEQLQKLTDQTVDKELTVLFISSEAPFIVQLSIEDGLAVADVLDLGGGDKEEVIVSQTDKPVESVKDPVEPSTTVDTETCQSVIYSESELKHISLSVGQRVKVQVSHTDDPSHFWVQLDSDHAALDDFLNALYEFYDEGSGAGLSLSSVKKGDIVAALFSEDESWYRSKVLSYEADEAVVQFLDHGNTDTVPVTSLRKLTSQFGSLPVQAMQCSLGGIQPAGETWSEEASDALADLTQEKVLLMDVLSQGEEGIYRVQLLDMGIVVSELLVKQGVGVEEATPVAISTRVKKVFTPDSGDSVISRLYQAKATNTLGQFGYKMRKIDWAGMQVERFEITAIYSPFDFWCRLQDNTYEFYQDKLQTSYTEANEQLETVRKGDKCVVLIEPEYHRAVVTVVEQDKVEVMCVDSGDVRFVSPAQIFALKPECEDYPQLGFQCSLTGVAPLEEEDWEPDACRVLCETVLELSERNQLPAPAQANVVTVEEGVVFVELTIDRRCLAESLIEKGVAKLDTIKDRTIDERDELSEVDNDFGAFGHIQLDCNKDYHVVLVDCDNLDRLVFHTIESLEKLKEIRDTIEEYVKDRTGGEGFDEGVKLGPCLARCAVDNLWHRANLCVVGKADEGGDSDLYQVYLVDYGSTYRMPLESLLPLPGSLQNIPGQAVIACLDEVEPADSKWSEAAHEFFIDQYINTKPQDLSIYVGSCGGGLHSVILSSGTMTEKSANHLMVELGLAVAILGSHLELSLLEDMAEVSFNELSMSRQDSFGDSEEQDADTTGLTDGDTTGYADIDTTGYSDIDTTVDTTGCTDADTTGITDGDTTGVTDADTTGFTDRDTTGVTDADTTGFTDGDTTGLTEADTTGLTDGDTTGVKDESDDGSGYVSSDVTLDGSSGTEDQPVQQDSEDGKVTSLGEKITEDINENKVNGLEPKSPCDAKAELEESEKEEDFEDAAAEVGDAADRVDKGSPDSDPAVADKTGDSEAFYDVEEDGGKTE